MAALANPGEGECGSGAHGMREEIKVAALRVEEGRRYGGSTTAIMGPKGSKAVRASEVEASQGTRAAGSGGAGSEEDDRSGGAWRCPRRWRRGDSEGGVGEDEDAPNGGGEELRGGGITRGACTGWPFIAPGQACERQTPKAAAAARVGRDAREWRQRLRAGRWRGARTEAAAAASGAGWRRVCGWEVMAAGLRRAERADGRELAGWAEWRRNRAKEGNRTGPTEEFSPRHN
uniref:PH01B015M02.1 protein n=1 Tax=Phyllostachys edulis TaxID=38705 RepID=L0P247_PHYED|nr:PH01B015M02.1 [Phyllostachys edulis]